jgi:hypothetical protein
MGRRASERGDIPHGEVAGPLRTRRSDLGAVCGVQTQHRRPEVGQADVYLTGFKGGPFGITYEEGRAEGVVERTVAATITVAEDAQEPKQPRGERGRPPPPALDPLDTRHSRGGEIARQEELDQRLKWGEGGRRERSEGPWSPGTSHA